MMQSVAVVTGASGGLGKAIVKSLAQDGIKIIINYNKSEGEANKIAGSIKGSKLIKADITKEEEVKNLFSVSGATNILINNAGVCDDGLIRKMSVEQWHKTLDVCATGTFLCSREFINQFIKNRYPYGRIINISSVASSHGLVGAGNYSAAKAAVEGFTRSAAKEFAQYKVTVNAISLGYFTVGMGERLSPDLKRTIINTIPLKRFGEAVEVTELIKFLCSPNSSYITGSVITVDGGFSA